MVRHRRLQLLQLCLPLHPRPHRNAHRARRPRLRRHAHLLPLRRRYPAPGEPQAYRLVSRRRADVCVHDFLGGGEFGDLDGEELWRCKYLSLRMRLGWGLCVLMLMGGARLGSIILLLG